MDRAIAGISWCLAFPKAIVTHLGTLKSNHNPVLLDTNPEDSFTRIQFQFEAVWIRDNECNFVVEKAWNEEACGLGFIKFYKKQAKTRETLRKWNKEALGIAKSGSTFLWTGLLKFKRGSHLRIMAGLSKNSN